MKEKIENKELNSITELKNTSYYQALYIWLLEEEIKIKSMLKDISIFHYPEREIFRFIFYGKSDGSIITVIEPNLTKKQYTLIKKHNNF